MCSLPETFSPFQMEALNQYLNDYLAGLSWFDFADYAFAISVVVYITYRVNTKINSLQGQADWLKESNQQALKIIDEQAQEITDLRKKVQRLHEGQTQSVFMNESLWPRDN